MNEEYKFDWYIFTNDNRKEPIAAFNDGELALECMQKLGDGAIKVHRMWLNDKDK